MRPDVAFGMKLRGLLDTFHARDFGKGLGEQAGLVKKLKSTAGMAFRKHLGKFVADALTANCFGFGCETVDGGGRHGIDLEVEAGGEANGAEHSKMIFFKALGGLADGANETGVEVGQALDVINHGDAKIACRLHRVEE